MIYYPKANITPNLFSNGEYVLNGSNEPYTGYYFSTYDGKFYTGREPGDGTNLFNLPEATKLATGSITASVSPQFGFKVESQVTFQSS